MNKVVAIHKPLTPKEQLFVENVAVHNMSDAAAARHAGFSYTGAGSEVSSRPHVMAAIREQRAINAQKLEVTREKILAGMQEAIERAKLYGEPMTEIAGWREIAKICGFYETPADKKTLTDKQQLFMKYIQELPEEQLLALMAKDVNVIEHEPPKAPPKTD